MASFVVMVIDVWMYSYYLHVTTLPHWTMVPVTLTFLFFLLIVPLAIAD